jgi:hypothetical protein
MQAPSTWQRLPCCVALWHFVAAADGQPSACMQHGAYSSNVWCGVVSDGYSWGSSTHALCSWCWLQQLSLLVSLLDDWVWRSVVLFCRTVLVTGVRGCL